jgi:hypothetical protein
VTLEPAAIACAAPAVNKAKTIGRTTGVFITSVTPFSNLASESDCSNVARAPPQNLSAYGVSLGDLGEGTQEVH